MSISSKIKHYHNRKSITDLAKSLQLKNINYDQGMEILERYYFGSGWIYHFVDKEHRLFLA